MNTADDYANWIVNNADKKGTPEFATVAAAYQQAKGSEAAPAQAEPSGDASLQDRAQAGAAGVNRAVLSNLPGLPVDTALNVADLAKAGYGYVGGKLGLLKPDQLPQLTDRANIPGSSEWIANKERAAGLGPTIDPNVPTDTASRRAFAFGQGGAAAMIGGPAAAARNFVGGGISQVLPQVVADAGGSPSSQVLASLAPAVLPTVASKIPTPTAPPRTPRDDAIQRAQDQGYVFPPSQVDQTGSSFVNSALEKLAGKAASQQGASVKNQNLTQEKVKRDFGIPENEPLTVDALQAVRREAGQAYEAVKGTGTIQPGPAYTAALDEIVSPYQKAAQGFPDAKPNPIIVEVNSLRSPSFAAESAVEKIRELRSQADVAYRHGDKTTGGALKSAAKALEDAIDQHLQTIGAPPDVLSAYRDARTTIAKTYTAQSAINPVTGVIDANKLAAALKRGKPLNGGMLEAARAASVSPKSMSSIAGAPGISKLDATTTIAALIASLAHPAALAAAFAPIASSAARSGLLSGPYQRVMVKPPGMPRNWADLLPPDNTGLLGAYAMPARQ
jgi:hypothetical protein